MGMGDGGAAGDVCVELAGRPAADARGARSAFRARFACGGSTRVASLASLIRSGQSSLAFVLSLALGRSSHHLVRYGRCPEVQLTHVLRDEPR